jgi:MinD superfamily P-loop ATPase
MLEITVLSGKGGTGKTTITGALAAVAKNAIFCDEDVDAANLHLLLNPNIQEEYEFSGGSKCTINNEICNECGICIDYCRFDAIHYNKLGYLVINPYQCEGCKLCEKVCPVDAITSQKTTSGNWYVSSTRFGNLVHAKMGAGEENSGKLVTQVRNKAKEIAHENNMDFLINDGPPGIGCATIAALSGTKRVLLVIEPTKSGLHDAQRLKLLIDTFRIKTFAVINKFDLHLEMSQEIEKYLQEQSIPLVAKIPFDPQIVEAMNEGKTIIEFFPESETSFKIREIWNVLKANSA